MKVIESCSTVANMTQARYGRFTMAAQRMRGQMTTIAQTDSYFLKPS